MPNFASKEIEFDAGHRVPGHRSKCRNPHGHRYRVRCTITGALVDRSGASDEGMVVDFGDLKTIMTEQIHDKFDHGFIVYDSDEAMKSALDCYDEEPWKVIVVDWIPTAENMARAIFEDLWSEVLKMSDDDRVTLFSVEVWETPTSMASYMGGV